MGTNTVSIKQPYQGDRGSLRVLVDAENLPAGAYSALEPLFDEAEAWATKWLSVETGEHGEKRHWTETTLRELPIESRAKNALTRHFGANETIGSVLDTAPGEPADRDELERLTTYVPNFGDVSLRALTNWINRQEEQEGEDDE